ncbi:MAG: hypothetical protein ABIE74_06725 [Pseudomonadota bacterium]
MEHLTKQFSERLANRLRLGPRDTSYLEITFPGERGKVTVVVGRTLQSRCKGRDAETLDVHRYLHVEGVYNWNGKSLELKATSSDPNCDEPILGVQDGGKVTVGVGVMDDLWTDLMDKIEAEVEKSNYSKVF